MSSHMNQEESEEDWDKDTEDINSIASDELHETRPNRWKGPPSTWLTFTAQERKAYQALEGLRRRDLSAHLYNAHALKTRVKRQKTEEATNDQTEDDQGPRHRENEWAPSHRWTAWPLRTGEVVDDELLPRTADEHEAFTLRRTVQTYPSKNLEEEISATILRCAKEKFRSRGFPEEDDEDDQSAVQPAGEGNDGVVDSIETGDNDDHHHAESSQLPSSPPRRNDESSRYSVPLSSPVKGEPVSQDENSKQTGSSSHISNSSRRRRRAPTPTYIPAPSVDDDRSYKLLRPASRRILSKLDETLTILHNARVAGLRDLSESSASDTEDNDNDAETEPVRQQQQQRTRRGRPRAPSPSPSAEATASESKPNPRSRRGRKRKVRIPLEGETEEEMLVRVARETHRRIPSFSRSRASSFHTTDDDDETASEADTEAVPPRSYQLPTSSKKTKRPTRDRSRSRSVTSTAAAAALTAVQEKDRMDRVARWGLRDWRDVLGAAALAGFPQSVIARATQRCSTLFGEEMTMHTLSSSKTKTTTYHPGDPLPESSDSEVDTADELEQRRTVSRQPSLVRTFSPPDDSQEDNQEDEVMEGVEAAPAEAGTEAAETERQGRGRTGRGRSESRARSRSRARRAGTPAPGLGGSGGLRVRRRSVTPAAGGDVYFCPYPECVRAVEGFARRANMHRHLKLVHGRSPPASPAGSVVGGDEDSMDEMDGGIHLDGFLQPIKVRKGWRGEDLMQRERERGRSYGRGEKKVGR
ncbi:RNA polymerase I-specific transcription initiation factor-domain-containing protein [Neurospora tetraspora]|uniref:RNA polymerase I-specific transcription initiation factor-domain-containing protein n=1 Tax=Neurospora tetraspora TaxID=94610 RepID=A0AAE0JQ00_9PEZI|nr:RNA polymerase I-specific transcription initiation factor-domain-containing protein [Neurospora tetraspora]